MDGQEVGYWPPPPHFPELLGASTLLDLNKALLDHVFPGSPVTPKSSILLPFKDCAALVAAEVERALTGSSLSLAPGPDTILNSVWKRIIKSTPPLILEVLSPLGSYGLHPLALKKANGIVLDKPGKPSYNSPSSFRVIILLWTFSKILASVRY